MADDELLVVMITAPNDEVAESLARSLVEERLAACVSRVPGLVSVYRWQGAIERESEIQLIVKTRRSHFEALAKRVHVLHPYDVPELIAHPVTHVSVAYGEWVRAQTQHASD